MAGFGGFGPAQGIIATAVVDNGTPVAGGTANGVLYVNSSGNLDSGSVLSFNGTNLSMASGQILAADGAVGTPAISFATDSNTGFYTGGSGVVWFSSDGAARVRLAGTSVWIATDTGRFGLGTTEDAMIWRDAAGILAQRNGTNAQILRVGNTFTSASVFEAFEVNWAAVANECILRTVHTGASAREITIAYGNQTLRAIRVPTAVTSAIDFAGNAVSTVCASGRVAIGRNIGCTSTAGTHIELNMNAAANPSSSSTMIFRGIALDTTVNYASGGAGQIKLLHFNPTNTALPTGLNAACVFSSTASTLGGMHFHNQTDEATNYEIARTYFTGNVFTIESTAAGSGTVRNINISVANAAASAVVTEVGTSTITGGVTDGYTSGLRQTPTYTAATAQTVTRHNYLDLNNPTLSGAGPAALTDACVVRFNAAAGTHKAVDSGTTKTTPGTVDAWVKVNINGTVYYMPCYTSKTA